MLNESFKISSGIYVSQLYLRQIIPIVLLSLVTGSEPKPVYWLIFYFPVFHVLTGFI